ncbi:MAG: hypothetical protein ABIT76_14775 [Chthoniobacterales bacterium]
MSIAAEKIEHSAPVRLQSSGMWRFSNSFRWVTVLVMAAAWMVAANHCAIGMVAALASHTEETCESCAHESHEHGDPSDSEHSNLTCCKIFKSVAATDGLVIKAPLESGTMDYLALLPVTVTAFANVASLPLANAPPGGCQFTSLVLERCHPGNAPPAFA